MASQPERVVLTYEDLIQLPNDRNRYELFDGELQVTAVPNIAHQTASFNLGLILGNYVRAHRLGRVFSAPCDVHFSETNVVEPDLLFVADGRAEIIQKPYVAGAPDLVVEILSPSTALADRQVKRQLYARFGVADYWLLDVERQEFIAFALADGIYQEVARGKETETVSAPPFPDLAISLGEIWE
ncbi:MAG TPA: Uma2 family endonuclease [Chloroflexota bacterium]|nr:Uma2 family endonuclease [Chloroflexota bacterium]